jgi:type II secretory ATPase GspE/PulE/Tfp pilus assembly ATPase PilB-like protein
MAEIVNWYEKIGANNSKKKLPKQWGKHHIAHNRMILLCIGPTGSGKTNALIDYISQSLGEFHKIFICSFATTDEPLLQLMKFYANRMPVAKPT